MKSENTKHCVEYVDMQGCMGEVYIFIWKEVSSQSCLLPIYYFEKQGKKTTINSFFNEYVPERAP